MFKPGKLNVCDIHCTGVHVKPESLTCVICIVQGFMFKPGKLRVCDIHCTGVHV